MTAFYLRIIFLAVSTKTKIYHDPNQYYTNTHFERLIKILSK